MFSEYALDSNGVEKRKLQSPPAPLAARKLSSKGRQSVRKVYASERSFLKTAEVQVGVSTSGPNG